MAVDLTRALLLIVGLGPGVAVTEVGGRRGGPLVIGVELTERPCCGGCGGKVWAHDENPGEPGGSAGIGAIDPAGVEQAPLALPRRILRGVHVH